MADDTQNQPSEGKKKIEAQVPPAESESKPLHGTYVASEQSDDSKKSSKKKS